MDELKDFEDPTKEEINNLVREFDRASSMGECILDILAHVDELGHTALQKQVSKRVGGNKFFNMAVGMLIDKELILRDDSQSGMRYRINPLRLEQDS